TSLLLQWRKQKSIMRNIDSDAILPKNKLFLLALYGPKTISELEKLEILGPVRLKMYGDEIINIFKKSDEFSEQEQL
ncbi:MAG: HRDC domain-containing protein, partial [Candidatus Hydrogenedens sp.]